MIINKIKLDNIRSYKSIELNFPKGNILLSGNIGSGKTSLLLAIDFVLFGLRKGALSGGSLLRHGEEKGSVEIWFNIDGKEIIVKRTLKKSKNGVTQDFGFISINGENFEGTAIQIKQKVLELFNYPSESLTKSKSLVYNYTIYTPQEEMKSILLADAQERLTILRKVFGIDKYQKIRDNSKIVLSSLKNNLKEMEFRISDLMDKINERDETRAKIRENENFLEEVNLKLKELKKSISEAKKQIELINEEKTKRERLKRDIEVINNSIKHLIENRARNNKEIEELKLDVNALEQEVKGFDDSNFESLNKRVLDHEEDLRKNEVLIKEINKKIYEAELKIAQSNKNKGEVIQLDYCIYCKQKVTEEHKDKIIHVEDLKLKENFEILDEFKSKLNNVEKIITNLKVELDKLRKRKSEFELYKFKSQTLDRKSSRIDSLILEQDKLKKDIGSLNVKSLDLNNSLELIPNVEERYKEFNEILDVYLLEEKKIITEKAKLDNECKLFKLRLDRLNEEINKAEVIKTKILNYSKLVSFLDSEFVNLVLTMEKQIMTRVHSDFDALFKDWFRMLVSDENLKIRLDNEFTPLIQQNGYDSDYLHLSGGERTAAALAYRLALNQVINTVMSDINTKDLLILDEPTDGFSGEQVDKIRLILDELGIEQIIIVSHDPKIESFVDYVLRFEKIDGVSKVIS